MYFDRHGGQHVVECIFSQSQSHSSDFVIIARKIICIEKSSL